MRKENKNEIKEEKEKKTLIQNISSTKDRKKFFRGILQGVFLLLVLCLIIQVLFSYTRYEAYTESVQKENGFIALSYFGVAVESDQNLIGTQELNNHLTALKNSGYVTITQQDIIDYYEKDKALPERALYLMFEDGRRDTSIFAQQTLEELNLKATMFSYGDKFVQRERKFLTGADMIDLEESTYWELGTNGYRLEYINVFDEDEEFLGRLTSRQYGEVVDTLGRDYNHYLMDYIRDAYDVPIESYEGMKDRINYDYQKLESSYQEAIQKVPQAYVLMHANTGQFGTNDKVSKVNETCIYDLFKMNFNREGYSLNNKEHSIYDLTRMQPQSYWSINHLLMRVWDDTKQEVMFVSGNTEKAKEWEMLDGAVEFKDEQIILTSMPRTQGTIYLKESEEFGNICLTVKLQGNKAGSQSIYLRADDQLEEGIQIEIKEDRLNLYEVTQGNRALVESNKLGTLENEDKPIQLKEPGEYLLSVRIEEDRVSIDVNKESIIEDYTVECKKTGSIYLSAAPLQDVYSQRNLTDDVYDARFEKLIITKIDETKDKEVLFDARLKGMDKGVYEVMKMVSSIINWFVETL